MDKHSKEIGVIEYVPITISLGKDWRLDWGEMDVDFWSTDIGEMWRNFIDEIEKLSYKAAPVTPTGSTELLSPFHDSRAAVAEGKDISPEEYGGGSKVCLVSQTFAKLNNLQIGQNIKLQMYFTDYECPTVANVVSINGMVAGMFRTDILTSEGRKYDVFYEADYTIKGFYSVQST